MKKYINRLAVLAACAVAFSACDENSWNDKLNGFEEPQPTDVEAISYTLSDYDYTLLYDNKGNAAAMAAAGDDLSQLIAASKQGYFTDVITPQKYIPYILSYYKFPYFTLDNGSAIKVTYNVTQSLPQIVTDVANAGKYTVSEEDYKGVWGSEEDYTNSFAPSHTAANSIPSLLSAAYPDAAAGDYVIVNYNTSSTDPVFSSTPEEPEFELTSVLGTAATGQTLNVSGYVSAFDTQGFILTDASGSIYCYRGNGFNDGSIEIGTQINLNGTVASRNKSIQFGNTATFEIVGSQEVTYPTPKTFTGAELDAIVAQTTIDPCTYVAMTGSVVLSGSNINLVIEGASTAKGSPSYCTAEQKALLTEGANVTVEGYWYAVAGNRYCSLCVTKVTVLGSATTTSATTYTATSRAVTVSSVKENAIYTFNGSAWVAPSNVCVLSHADYQAMGQTYDNLSGDGPAMYLPSYLKQKYPYAQPDDVKYVAYYFYNSSAKETTTRCDEYKFNGTEWVINNGITTETAQFVKAGGVWKYDPSVTLYLPVDASSKPFYSACVEYVANNVTDGSSYINRGDSEYYSGASAFYNNVNHKVADATKYTTHYEGMSDDEILDLLEERFENEVAPYALKALYPDAAPVQGVQVLYTVNVGAYYGSNPPPRAVIVFEVVGLGEFKCISADWNRPKAK